MFATIDIEDAGSIVESLKKQIEQRFGFKDVLDRYLFLPIVAKEPTALLDVFERAEGEIYEVDKKQYIERKAWRRPQRDSEHRPDDPEQLFSFQEYPSFRKGIGYKFHNSLADVYEILLKQPESQRLEMGVSCMSGISAQLERTHGKGQPVTDWHDMEPYWQWVVMLYGPELVRKLGGFEIADAGLLPMGMVNLFRSGRENWSE